VIDWNKYRTTTGGPINLQEALEDNIDNYADLPPEDHAMIISLVGEIEALNPIHSNEAAAVALVMIRQFLVSAQILGTILGQMGIVMKSAEDIQAQKNREAIRIVSKMPLKPS